MRDDYMLERKLEQLAQCRQRPFLVPRGRPDPELAVLCGQRVGEDKGALLGQPDRRLVATAAVVEGDGAARQLGSRLDPLELRLRDVLPPEEVRPVGARAVAPDEQVDVADVIRLQNDDGRRRRLVEPSPDLICIVRRRERIEEDDLSAGRGTGRGDGRRPADVRRPVGVVEPPDPETGSDVSNLGSHAV
ncbi:MAG: hypothetical protein WKF41_07580 [Gaiellaceae bacterium]